MAHFPFVIYLCAIFCHQVVARVVITKNVAYDSGPSEWKSTVKSRPFDAFIGLPYAKPPLADLRFALPKSSDIKGHFYAGIADNPRMTTICTQMDFQERVDGQEDCLILHVYVPGNASFRECPLHECPLRECQHCNLILQFQEI